MPAARTNPNVRSLFQPLIPMVKSWSEAYTHEFGPLLDLSQAVPNFIPHTALIRSLGLCAANPELFGYGPIEGEPALRETYAQSVASVYGADIKASHTHITAGCNQAFMATMIAIAGAGDRVVMCNPYYFNHQTALSMLGVDVDFVRCHAENAFIPRLEDIRAALADGTRALVLTSPNNPTGAIYPAELLHEIFQLCQEAGVWLVIDETYRDFLAEPSKPPHALFSQKDWQDNLIQLYSFSKSFCIPGHRLGAVTASPSMIAEVSKVMDNLQICAPRAAQVAVSQTFTALSDWRENNRQEILRRSNALLSSMEELPEWRVVALGAYFAFVEHPFGTDSVSVAKALAERCGVTCLPGEFFGDGNHRYLRFAFANVDGAALSELPAKLRHLIL